jgi:hypothetical protein
MLWDAPPDTVEMPSPVAVELKRRHAAADRVLARLEQCSALNTELVTIAMNLTARVSELRQRGYQIDAERVSAGVYRYRLIRKSGECA